VLFGHWDSGGRMPLTTPHRLDDLPDFADYDLRVGRTYRYMDLARILYAFGPGLSYTRFGYRDASVEIADDTLHIQVELHNCDERAGEEVAHVYLQEEDREQAPRLELIAFRRSQLDAGASIQLHRCALVVGDAGHIRRCLRAVQEALPYLNQQAGRNRRGDDLICLHQHGHGD